MARHNAPKDKAKNGASFEDFINEHATLVGTGIAVIVIIAVIGQFIFGLF